MGQQRGVQQDHGRPDLDAFWSGGSRPEVPQSHGGYLPKPASPGNDRADVVSQSGMTDYSEADSQREVFTQRNRVGHGNILTWGGDSRSITPPKNQHGRQIIHD